MAAAANDALNKLQTKTEARLISDLLAPFSLDSMIQALEAATKTRTEQPDEPRDEAS